MKSLYDIQIRDIKGAPLDLRQFEGKYLLIVNVASACGYTPQYKGLQNLYENFGERINILGCPCNDFGGQEPGSAQDIEQFCSTTYQVTFPLTDKVRISSDPHPLYQWLCSQEENGHSDNQVNWNFNKFLIGPEGNLISYFSSSVDPLDDRIIGVISA